ncbi:MAG: UDP-N-acetylmuramate dehydrogenase [Patescibacteria group bacterium]
MDFETGVKLKNLGSFKIGGEARFFKRAKTLEDLINTVEDAKKRRLPFFILGGGTNILFSDADYEGLVLKPDFINLGVVGNKITAGAGVNMTELVNLSVENNLSGLEWAGGLPGTFGGALRGNAGAFGGELKDAVERIISFDTQRMKLTERCRKECGFGYRTSVFKLDRNEIIIEATLTLTPGSGSEIKEKVESRIAYRKQRHPLDHFNVGSVFKNVVFADYPHLGHPDFRAPIKQDPFPVVPTAYLLSEAKLQGVACGGAMISPKHPNFIVNVFGATASDVKSLIELAKSEVKEKFGVELEEEILIF